MLPCITYEHGAPSYQVKYSRVYLIVDLRIKPKEPIATAYGLLLTIIRTNHLLHDNYVVLLYVVI